jgi:hypothetical protein
MKKKELERTSFAAFTQNLLELEEKLKKDKEEEAKLEEERFKNFK